MNKNKIYIVSLLAINFGFSLISAKGRAFDSLFDEMEKMEKRVSRIHEEVDKRIKKAKEELDRQFGKLDTLVSRDINLDNKIEQDLKLTSISTRELGDYIVIDIKLPRKIDVKDIKIDVKDNNLIGVLNLPGLEFRLNITDNGTILKYSATYFDEKSVQKEKPEFSSFESKSYKQLSNIITLLSPVSDLETALVEQADFGLIIKLPKAKSEVKETAWKRIEVK